MEADLCPADTVVCPRLGVRGDTQRGVSASTHSVTARFRRNARFRNEILSFDVKSVHFVHSTSLPQFVCPRATL